MNTILSLSLFPSLGFIIPMGGGWGLWLVLIVPTIILGIWAQHRVTSTYRKYSQVPSRGRISGAEAASAVMRKAGITDVEIVEIGGHLTDHYDPVNKRLALSSANYRGTSLAALGVSAHEAGHAIQHKVGYKALNLRMALIPVTSFASQILPIVLIASFFLPLLGVMGIKIAVVCYLILTVFQLITLPVEFDASARARKELVGIGIIDQDESIGVVRTLNAAGWTYVAAFISSLANLIFLFLLSRDR